MIFQIIDPVHNYHHHLPFLEMWGRTGPQSTSSNIQDAKEKINVNTLFYLLQDTIAKKSRLLELITKKNCGKEIITLVTESIQIYYLHT